MIKETSRANWFGCSDTNQICGGWHTKTFENWWKEKCGIPTPSFQNKYTLAGTHYEHKILEAVKIIEGYDDLHYETDKQLLIPKYRIRANLDGSTKSRFEGDVPRIYECKTYKDGKDFKVSLAYYRQAQAEMFAWKEYFGEPCELTIVAYPLTEMEYKNWFRPIDRNKISFHPVEYDENFINNVYLPRIKILAECIKVGRWPVLPENLCKRSNKAS